MNRSHIQTVVTLLGPGILTLSAGAGTTPAEPLDFSRVDLRAARLLAENPTLQGVGVFVSRAGGDVLHEAYFGAYDENTKVPLASASKLISAAAVATLIDSGELDPASPLRTLLPDVFAPSQVGFAKASLTTDQLYSMTSGFPGTDTPGAGGAADGIMSDLSITLAEAVDEIACCVDLAEPPGTALIYTGLGMHVVGRVCEVVSGMPFDAFFAGALADPIGAGGISWDGLGETTNYRASGGGASSMPDYARVLDLLLSGGTLDGVRVLSPETVEWMFEERTVGLPVLSAPPQAIDGGYGYAFGSWVESRDTDGRTLSVVSPGAFGFTPWIDLEDGYFGIVMVEGRNRQLAGDIQEIRDLIEAVVAPCPADFNTNGIANFFDVSAFLNAFAAGETAADLNHDGALDFFDVQAFLNDFAAGCETA